MTLINRQAAIDALGEQPMVWTDSDYELGRQNQYDSDVSAIQNVPAIDAVEVVRGKDCKHLFDGEHNANCCDVLMEKAKWVQEIIVDDNWYCGDGKRRIDETD